MNAHEFLAEKGIDKAKRVLELASDAWAYDAEEGCFFDGSDLQDGYSIEHCNGCFLVEELKQVVKSVELLESYGGVDKLHEFAISVWRSNKNDPFILRAKQAIADYELVESYKEK